MKLEINKPVSAPALMKNLGYHQTDNPEKISYQRRLRPGQVWPRYHIYLQVKGSGLVIDLHVDQKAETRHYRAVTAHNGEYDGPLVEQEIERIKGLISSI